MNIQPAIDLLKEHHRGSDNPATIEQMAEACGIALDAPCSYREVVEMAEALALSPYVTRVWVNGERVYYASHYVPYEARS